MTATDSNEFMELVPAISLREAERGSGIGGGCGSGESGTPEREAPQ